MRVSGTVGTAAACAHEFNLLAATAAPDDGRPRRSVTVSSDAFDKGVVLITTLPHGERGPHYRHTHTTQGREGGPKQNARKNAR